jgi:hypothetical protein
VPNLLDGFSAASVSGRIVPNVAEMTGERKKEYAKCPTGLNFSTEPAKVTRHDAVGQQLNRS